MSGTFDLLYQPKSLGGANAIKLKDIREFARDLVETTGNEEEDRESYLRLLPRGRRAELENHSYDMKDFKSRFEKRDLTLYQDYDLWYKAI